MSKKEIERALFKKHTRRERGPEASVQHACLEYLNIAVPQCVAWRQNSGVQIVEATETVKRKFIRFGAVGALDIAGMLRGVHLEIEVKARGKKASDAQNERIAMINEKGGIAFCCDSLDSLIEQLRREHQKRGWQ